MDHQHEKQHEIKVRWLVFLLPIISFALSFIACLVAYIISVNTGKLAPLPFIPYISDTGNVQPSSSVFTLFLVLSCFAASIVVVVRYYQLGAESQCPIANRVALVVSFVFLVGKIPVSSFQLSSNKFVHYGAAGLYFVGAAIYCILHCYITRQKREAVIGNMSSNTQERRNLSIVYGCRIVCCVGVLVNLIIFLVFASVPSLRVHNRSGANVAQIVEWLLALFKIVFIMTFCYDFWNIDFTFAINFQNARVVSAPVEECQVRTKNCENTSFNSSRIDCDSSSDETVDVGNLRKKKYIRFDSKKDEVKVDIV